MDQVKIGKFLKELRKEKDLTQEALAERLGVSNRTVSRWETGSNMPDTGMLIEIAELYGVSIPEIIRGERKSGEMNQETKETEAAMAEYGKNETKRKILKTAGLLICVFGAFITASALIIFPAESSWSGIYSVFGGIIFLAGIYLLLRLLAAKRLTRVLAMLGCAVLLFCAFHAADYAAVEYFGQVPRFRYSVGYESSSPDELVYKTIFFTAVRENPGEPDEKVYIVK